MARAPEDVPALVLKAGREKSLLRRHPWVFSGAIERADARARPGDTVAVRASSGGFLAWAAYSPQSQIRARVWSWDEREAIDERFFEARVRRAIARRAGIAGAAGAERWREAIVDAVLAASGCRVAYERSDLDVRALEGLAPRAGPIRGTLREATVGIVEHGLAYRVDVAHGQKTGFYLDQRANRDRVRALAAGR